MTLSIPREAILNFLTVTPQSFYDDSTSAIKYPIPPSEEEIQEVEAIISELNNVLPILSKLKRNIEHIPTGPKNEYFGISKVICDKRQETQDAKYDALIFPKVEDVFQLTLRPNMDCSYDRIPGYIVGF